MSNSVSNELINAKKLFNEGKFEEILQLTKEIGQKKTLNHEELLKTKGYKGLSYLFLGQFETPQIINSEYARKEISLALKKKKPFFAVYLKETKLPTELEFEIADIQAMMSHLMPKAEFQTKLKELLNNSLSN